jgi:Holliday junction DNA helicase RuvA
VVLAGGVGYELWLGERTRLRLPAPGNEVRFFTHLQVREDAMTLFGFQSAEEREVFRALISVSGVGPKVALSLVGSPQAESVLGAIAAGDARPLLAVKGIGKKTAERIVLELEERAASWAWARTPEPRSAEPSLEGHEQEAALVLESMGLSLDRARAAVAAARTSLDHSEATLPAVEGLVREALRHVNPPG